MLLTFLWGALGAYLLYKAELLMNYNFHMKFAPIIDQVVGNPFKDFGVYLFLIPAALLGPFSIMFIALAYLWTPKYASFIQGLTAKVGHSYINLDDMSNPRVAYMFHYKKVLETMQDLDTKLEGLSEEEGAKYLTSLMDTPQYRDVFSNYEKALEKLQLLKSK